MFGGIAICLLVLFIHVRFSSEYPQEGQFSLPLALFAALLLLHAFCFNFYVRYLCLFFDSLILFEAVASGVTRAIKKARRG